MNVALLRPGDPVWYRQTCRGGYGQQRDVPCTFVRATERRVVVRVELRTGGAADVAVAHKNVRVRVLTQPPPTEPKGHSHA